MESRGNESNSQESLGDEMTIYLQVMKKNTVALEVEKTHTIEEIKWAFCEMEDICHGFQELFLNGEQLKDDQSVADYGIWEGCTLHMILKDPPMVELSVEMPSENISISLEARADSTISYIKALILAKEGIQPDQYSLIYAGSKLKDYQTLVSISTTDEYMKFSLEFYPSDEISFSVITPNRGIVNLMVADSCSVSDVKAMVGKNSTGIDVSEYALSYQGIQLEDSMSLAFYHVYEGSILLMSYPTFRIFAWIAWGETVALDVNRGDTIKLVMEKAWRKLAALRAKRKKKLDASHDRFYFVFKQTRLELSENLAHYNIQKHDYLRIVREPEDSESVGYSKVWEE